MSDSLTLYRTLMDFVWQNGIDHAGAAGDFIGGLGLPPPIMVFYRKKEDVMPGALIWQRQLAQLQTLGYSQRHQLAQVAGV